MTDHHEAEAHQGDDDWQPIGIFAARIAGKVDPGRLRQRRAEEPVSGSIEGKAAVALEAADRRR